MLVNISRRRLLAAGVVVCVLLSVLALTTQIIPRASANPKPKPPTASAAQCAKTPLHFYSHDLTPNFFGPAVSEEAQAAVKAMHDRRCADAALMVAHREYQERHYTTPQERLVKTVKAMDGNVRAFNVVALELREAKATKVEVVEMSGKYQTLYMTKDTVPQIWAAAPDRPTFRVLKFTYSDGSWDAYKLDCGFQPVMQSFPGLPTTPPPPPTGGGGSGPPPTTTPTTRPQAKCSGPGHEFGGKVYCGTPTSGPEQQPVQDNDPAQVAPTPGYTPGNAELPHPGTDSGGGGGASPGGNTTNPDGSNTGGTNAGTSNPVVDDPNPGQVRPPGDPGPPP